MEAPPGTCFRKSKLHLAPAGISGAHKLKAGTTLHRRHRATLERPRPGSGREERGEAGGRGRKHGVVGLGCWEKNRGFVRVSPV